MKRRYLITGAQGLIGRYLAARILGAQRDAEVLGVGRSNRIDGFFTHAIRAGGEPRRAPMPAGLHACLDGRYRYRQLSLLETGALRDLIRDFRPGCVFHLASALHTASERDLFEINVEGTASLMNALCDSPETLLIAGSSASVYGEACALPIQESHPCRPADMYGVTKLTAEHLVRVKAERAGLPFVLARIFSVAGPGQTETHVCGRFAAQVAALAGIPQPALEVGPLDPTRDFIDVRDVASALWLLAQAREPRGTYNVASGRETAIHAVLSELLRIAGLEGRARISQRSGHPGGVTRQVADISRLSQLGFRPQHSIAESLCDLFRYYQAAGRGLEGERAGEAEAARLRRMEVDAVHAGSGLSPQP